MGVAWSMAEPEVEAGGAGGGRELEHWVGKPGAQEEQRVAPGLQVFLDSLSAPGNDGAFPCRIGENPSGAARRPKNRLAKTGGFAELIRRI